MACIELRSLRLQLLVSREVALRQTEIPMPDYSAGKLSSKPTPAVALLLEWWHLHRAELLQNWQLARAGAPLRSIKPLE